jgi:hypothetical protein
VAGTLRDDSVGHPACEYRLFRSEEATASATSLREWGEERVAVRIEEQDEE